MNQKEMFGKAIWVCAGKYNGRNPKILQENGVPYFPVLRKTFVLNKFDKAILRVVGLGYFHCYINGKEVTENAFLPLATDYEERENYPTEEKLTSHRIYVPQFDVTDYLKEGKNLLALHFGGGWYSHDCDDAFYGQAKAIYCLSVINNGVKTDYVSSTKDKIGDSFVKTYWFTELENHDYRFWNDDTFNLSFDDSHWGTAKKAEQVDTNYLFSDCPIDVTAENLMPKAIKKNADSVIYDIGKNCSCVPVFELLGEENEEVTVLFSEEKNSDNSLNMDFFFGQKITFICDGKKRLVEPKFTWFSFRYFEVIGNARPKLVKFIHSDIKPITTFKSDNKTLNWLYDAYLNTQLSNMHGGIPSDCPHLERRGYTGDGQLTCHAAMTLLDSQKFYKKWISDISDCQDIYTGHIQYTAPYNKSGGGPGGWGCAIVEVPYQYYKHYGDKTFLQELYPQMLNYFRYLDNHSINNILSSDKPGDWCLGDWCSLNGVKLPDAYVNNYFYIKSLMRMVEIAKITNHKSHIPYIKDKINALKLVTKAAYYNDFYGSFCGGIQAADAFAVDIGIGDERAYSNLVKRYENLGYFDTGIFGTDVLTRVLFEHGDGELALKLITNNSKYSFNEMIRMGATSLWENWPNDIAVRSRNHPMFGAITAYLFDYLLGIRQENGKYGYKEIIVAPAVTNEIKNISGSLNLPKGEIAVSIQNDNKKIKFTITMPKGVKGKFIYKDFKKPLEAGENIIEL